MPPAYMINVYDIETGSKMATLGLQDDVRSLVIDHRVNVPGNLTIGLYLHSYAVDYFTTDCLVEVRRRVSEAGLDWYTEYIGLHRSGQKQITEADSQIFYTYSRGLLDLVKRRTVRYYADTDGSDKGPAPADDIMKEYVYENVGAGAVAGPSPARITDGVTPGLEVAPDASEAATIETANAWRNMLDVLTDIGPPNNVDFDVEWGGPDDPLTFTFQTYYPQLGDDRREGSDNPFVFSVMNGNMQEPSFTRSRTDEITDVLVLGPGEGVDRDVTHVASTDTDASILNLIEQNQDASGVDTTDALIAIGNGVLYDKRAAVQFSFTPIQNAQSCYGKDYRLGDIVTARFDAQDAVDMKLVAVTVILDEGGAERLNIELEEVPSVA